MRPTRTLLALAVAVACSTAAAATDGAATQSMATDPLLRRAYLTDHDSGMLSILDLDRMSLLAARPAGRAPTTVASNAAASRLYVLDEGAASVNVLDAGGEPVAFIPLEPGRHAMVADFQVGEVFVANTDGGSLTVIDAIANVAVATIHVGSEPGDLAVDRVRGRIYATDRSIGAIVVIDRGTRRVVAAIPVGAFPAAPVVDELSGRVFVNNVADATVSIIDGETTSVLATLPCGQGAESGTFSPEYRKYFVANALDATLTVIDADALAVERTVPLGALPRKAVVDAGGGTVLVPSRNADTVAVIAAVDGRRVGTIRTTFAPARIATDASDRLLVVDDRFTAATAVTRTNLAPETAIAAEYYHAGFGHFFHSSDPVELRLLDDGIYGAAWTATQQFWRVWTAPGKDRVPVCRLYSAGATPRTSHVYTPYADECEALKAGPTWQFESIAYFVALPDEGGACIDGTEPLYRLYNEGRDGAPNHRFTRERSVRDAMTGAGWVAEGQGVDRVFACTPVLRAGGAMEVRALPMPKAPPPLRRVPIPLRPRPA